MLAQELGEREVKGLRCFQVGQVRCRDGCHVSPWDGCVHGLCIGHSGHGVAAACDQQGGGGNARDGCAQIFAGQGFAAAGLTFGVGASDPALRALHYSGLRGNKGFSEPAAG